MKLTLMKSLNFDNHERFLFILYYFVLNQPIKTC